MLELVLSLPNPNLVTPISGIRRLHPREMMFRSPKSLLPKYSKGRYSQIKSPSKSSSLIHIILNFDYNLLSLMQFTRKWIKLSYISCLPWSPSHIRSAPLDCSSLLSSPLLIYPLKWIPLDPQTPLANVVNASMQSWLKPKTSSNNGTPNVKKPFALKSRACK